MKRADEDDGIPKKVLVYLNEVIENAEASGKAINKPLITAKGYFNTNPEAAGNSVEQSVVFS